MRFSAGADGRACLWGLDAAAGAPEPLARLPGDAAWVEHLAWSPDGARLASASARVLRLWGPDGMRLARSEPHGSAVSGIAWCGADEVATACYGRVSFLDGATAGRRETLEWKGSLISQAVSPDLAIVAGASQDRSVHFCLGLSDACRRAESVGGATAVEEGSGLGRGARSAVGV